MRSEEREVLEVAAGKRRGSPVGVTTRYPTRTTNDPEPDPDDIMTIPGRTAWSQRHTLRRHMPGPSCVCIRRQYSTFSSRVAERTAEFQDNWLPLGPNSVNPEVVLSALMKPSVGLHEDLADLTEICPVDVPVSVRHGEGGKNCKASQRGPF